MSETRTDLLFFLGSASSLHNILLYVKVGEEEQEDDSVGQDPVGEQNGIVAFDEEELTRVHDYQEELDLIIQQTLSSS